MTTDEKTPMEQAGRKRLISKIVTLLSVPLLVAAAVVTRGRIRSR